MNIRAVAYLVSKWLYSFKWDTLLLKAAEGESSDSIGIAIPAFLDDSVGKSDVECGGCRCGDRINRVIAQRQRELMFGIWFWIIAFVVSFCVYMIRRRNHALDDDEDNSAPTINVQTKSVMAENEYERMDTTTLVKTLLGKLNYQVDEGDDGALFFTYQGERFMINCSKDSLWISIVDGQWYDCPLDNLEEISCMQKAINFANSRNVCTAIYNINKERNEFEVYSKFDTVIVPQNPSLDRLLSVWLGSFFQLKQKVVMELEKEKQMEVDNEADTSIPY